MKKVLCFLVTVVAIFLFLYLSNDKLADELDSLVLTETHKDWQDSSAEEPVDMGSKYKFYFHTLSEKQKKAYNNIFYEIMYAEDSFPERIEIPLMESEELTQVYEAVIYDNPEIICFGKGASIITEGERCFLKPEYTMLPEEFRRKTTILSEKAEKFCSVFTEGMSDFDKELYIHDYIVNHCAYGSDEDDCGLAYTCLFSGYASCEGYSKAVKYLLDKAGIECAVVIGDAENLQNETESHMWNLVNIDGCYYYLDATWDDPDGDSEYISHTYFNLTENEIRADHSNFTAMIPCSSTEANYYVKTGSLFSSAGYYDRLKMEDIIVSNLEKGENRVEFRFTDEKAYNSAIDSLITQSGAYKMQENIRKKYPEFIMSDEISYSKNERYRIIEFIF